MRYTLTSHGTLLGHTGAELTGPTPGTPMRSWHFLPAAGFPAAGEVLLELQRASRSMAELMPSAETLATIREEERSAFVRHAMMSDPGAPRFLELMDTVEAMALQLRDDAGVLMPAQTLGVTELEFSPEAFRSVLEEIDPSSDPALSAVPPFYLLVAGL
jgi:hypothetical protein